MIYLREWLNFKKTVVLGIILAFVEWCIDFTKPEVARMSLSYLIWSCLINYLSVYLRPQRKFRKVNNTFSQTGELV